jgi:hypothetical protein
LLAGAKGVCEGLDPLTGRLVVHLDDVGGQFKVKLANVMVVVNPLDPLDPAPPADPPSKTPGVQDSQDKGPTAAAVARSSVSRTGVLSTATPETSPDVIPETPPVIPETSTETPEKDQESSTQSHVLRSEQVGLH